jgi:anti-sigma B factor antagonist
MAEADGVIRFINQMFHHEDLQIHQREVQGVTILDLHGKVEMGRGDIALREYGENLLAQGNRQLILDLARVSAIDASGAAVLLFLFEQYRACGGKLVLLKLDKVHADIWEVARLEAMMEMCGDEVDAVNSFFPDRAVARYDILEYVEEHAHEDDKK